MKGRDEREEKQDKIFSPEKKEMRGDKNQSETEKQQGS